MALAFSRRHAELGFAAVLVAAAGFLFTQAGAYRGMSGTYPRTLAILLAIGGILLIGRTLVQHRTEDDRVLFEHPGRVVIGAVVLIVYIAAVSTIGYLLPSLLLGLALPFVLGYRDLRLSALVTLGTLVFIVFVFVVLLGRPFPRDLLDPLLTVIR